MALLVQDTETGGSLFNQVTARPTRAQTSLGSQVLVAVMSVNKHWALNLPWLSESDPVPTDWVLVRADGSVITGTVPEGVLGPVSVSSLIDLYGWRVNPAPPTEIEPAAPAPAGVTAHISPPLWTLPSTSMGVQGYLGVLIQDQELAGSLYNEVTARPTRQPLVVLVNAVWVQLDDGLVTAAMSSQRRWSLKLPWRSQSDPSDTDWVIWRTDGTTVSGTVPEAVAGPLTVDDLVLTYGWRVDHAPAPDAPTLLDVQPAVVHNNSYPTNVVYLRGGGGGGSGGAGTNWQGPWDDSTHYAVNDLVEFEGSTYISIQANTEEVPSITSSFWELFAQVGSPGPPGEPSVLFEYYYYR